MDTKQLTDDAMMAAITSVCAFDAERAEKWRPEALAIGRAVERAVLAALAPSDAAGAPTDVRIPMDIAIDARRMRTLRRLLDAMDDMGNGFPGAVHTAFQDGGQSTCRALDEAAMPEDLIHAAPVAPAAVAPKDQQP